MILPTGRQISVRVEPDVPCGAGPREPVSVCQRRQCPSLQRGTESGEAPDLKGPCGLTQQLITPRLAQDPGIFVPLWSGKASVMEDGGLDSDLT